MKYLFALCITFYQKFLSPLKGFRCAHGVLHGESCSQLIKEEILSQGFIHTIPIMRSQFTACREANDIIIKNREKEKKRPCNISVENMCDAVDCFDVLDCSSASEGCNLTETCSSVISCDNCGSISCCDF